LFFIKTLFTNAKTDSKIQKKLKENGLGRFLITRNNVLILTIIKNFGFKKLEENNF
jgi:hypothetical protein